MVPVSHYTTTGSRGWASLIMLLDEKLPRDFDVSKSSPGYVIEKRITGSMVVERIVESSAVVT